jgi:hypothetical protein
MEWTRHDDLAKAEAERRAIVDRWADWYEKKAASYERQLGKAPTVRPDKTSHTVRTWSLPGIPLNEDHLLVVIFALALAMIARALAAPVTKPLQQCV